MSQNSLKYIAVNKSSKLKTSKPQLFSTSTSKNEAGENWLLFSPVFYIKKIAPKRFF
jgi:hypothetical protein